MFSLKEPLYIDFHDASEFSLYLHKEGLEVWIGIAPPFTYKEVMERTKAEYLGKKFASYKENESCLIDLKKGWIIQQWMTLKPHKKGMCKLSCAIGPHFPLGERWAYIEIEKVNLFGEEILKHANRLT